MNWTEVAPKLAEPFEPRHVQWRAGSVSRDKLRAQALAYAEPRVYEDRLNEVLGADWEMTFEPWGEQRLTCTLTIWLEDETGERRAIRRSSTGEFDAGDRVSQGTTAEAQAMKRACSKFGLGRYLYDLPASWVGYDEKSRRLTETPALPKAALPRAVSAKPAVVQTEKVQATKLNLEPKLNASRANVLGQRLVAFGFAKETHSELASKVTERPIKALADLTESEALAVFHHAESNAQEGAKAA